MEQLNLQSFHHSLGAQFTMLNGIAMVANYGDPLPEQLALAKSVGILDLSYRGRFCVTGSDRVRFLHGQVTNDIKSLKTGEGCYAAIVSAKGKMQADVNIYHLPDELLLDFEPRLNSSLLQRLEKFIIADDVQVVDVAGQYGLLSVQGPESEAVLRRMDLVAEVPARPFSFCSAADATLGEVYVMNRARLGTTGFDLFVPQASLETLFEKLVNLARLVEGRACGWDSLETVRLEQGIPRFGVDMDENNFPHECGIEGLALSYTKGCYIGQEVLNRIHTLGHVNRELRGLRLEEGLKILPKPREMLFRQGREVGYITSAVTSQRLKANLALGYVRKECNEIGTELSLRTTDGDCTARIVATPF
jgi:aminomethyltransferase